MNLAIPAVAGLLREAGSEGIRAVGQLKALAKANDGADVPASGDAALRRVIAQYDVENISPREFSELLERLTQTGTLPPQDLQTLTNVRLELDKAGYPPDESINLRDVFRRRVAQLAGETQNQETPELSRLRQEADWIERLAALQQGAGAADWLA